MNSKRINTDICSGNDLVVRLEGDTLVMRGDLVLGEASAFVNAFSRHFRSVPAHQLRIDLNGLKNIDSAGVMALYYTKKKLKENGVEAELEGGSASVLDKIRLFYPEEEMSVVFPRRQGFLEQTGARVREFFGSFMMEFLLLASNLFYWGFADLFRPSVRRRGDVVTQATLIGVNAAGIVVFLSFVIGFVIALHSAGQLRPFGANIFIVDLVVFSIMSQMGPLLAAILVAGRSGSAIAAEIGTMKVTAELDAIQTMGLHPIRFLLVPKLYACMLTMPFLIVFANVAGITGGALAANIYLDITPEIFINRMRDIMMMKDLYTALVKSQVYAGIIVLTGSFYGFRVVRGAEDVGRMTTIAVVVSITLVILADSVLGVIFY